MSTSIVTNLVASVLRRPPARPLLSAVRCLQTTQVLGFKDRDVLRLRCKECYFKKVDFRWWVLCPTFPRHHQRERLQDIRRKWIVTHITTGGRPFQKKEEAFINKTAPAGPYDYSPNIWWKQLGWK